METCHRSDNRIIERAVNRAAPRHGVDKTGRDVDDYRQIFRIKAWLSAKVVPDHGKDAYERWQFIAVRNQFCSCKREFGWYPDLARYDLLPDDDYRRCAPSFEHQMEVRELVTKLRVRLVASDWQLLLDYVAHGCSAVSVWEAYGRQVSCGCFRRQIRDLRELCQQLIGKMF